MYSAAKAIMCIGDAFGGWLEGCGVGKYISNAPAMSKAIPAKLRILIVVIFDMGCSTQLYKMDANRTSFLLE